MKQLLNKKTVNRKAVIAVAAAAGISGVLLILLYLSRIVPLQGNYFNRQVQLLCARSGADSSSVDSVTVKVWESITVEGMYLQYLQPEYSLTLRASRLVLKGSLPKFLAARKKIREIFTVDTNKNMSEIESVRRAGSEMVNRMPVTASGVEMRYRTGKGFTISGSDGEMTFSTGNDGPNIVCMVNFPVVDAAGETVTGCSLTMVFFGNGGIQLKNLKGTYCGSRLTGNAVVDCDVSGLLNGELHLDSLKLSTWYPSHIGTGTMEGLCTAHYKMEQSPLKYQLPRGTVTCTLSNASFSQIPLLDAFASALGIPSLAALHFTECTAYGVINLNDTITAGFTGKGDDLNGGVDGWISGDGQLNCMVRGTFPRSMARKLSRVIRESLPSDTDGGRSFSCRVYGSLAEPRFELDRKIVERAIESIFNDISREYLQMYEKR